MPPCMDVYVWLPEQRPQDFVAFIDRYVGSDQPSGFRLAAFRRVYIDRAGTDQDTRDLAELQMPGNRGAFSLYLRGRGYYQAIITIAQDGAVVLGVSIDDPDGSAATLDQASRLLDQLREEFGSPAGVAGVELPPPLSRSEWAEEAGVQIRVGALPIG